MYKFSFNVSAFIWIFVLYIRYKTYLKVYLKHFANVYICMKAVSYTAIFTSVILNSKQKFQ